jgi:uncharacterized membrane protein
MITTCCSPWHAGCNDREQYIADLGRNSMTTDSASHTDNRARSSGSGQGRTAQGVNVGDGERLFSMIAGGAVGLWGLRRLRLGGLALAALGGALLYRGLSGYCQLYGALGIDRAATLTGETRGTRGVKIEREITIAAPADTLYRIWRDLESLPRFMSHLARVERLDDRRSRWTVKTPAGVPEVQWDAEIINDRHGELIAWQSVSGAVDHAGSVRFERAPDFRSTLVRVSLQYDPPGGEVGHTVASLFGQDAGTQIDTDLRELKRAVEAGEMIPGPSPTRIRHAS